MEMLTPEDVKLINDSGRSVAYATHQIRVILSGKKYLDLVEPALIENGRIRQIKESEMTHLVALWKNNIAPYTTKFVPSSGAASRMFKALKYVYNNKHQNVSEISQQISELETGSSRKDSEKEVIDGLTSFMTFWNELDNFPFYNELASVLKDKGISIEKERSLGKVRNIIHYLLDREGMNYANKPKLFLTFHLDGGTPRTAMEEHIKESLWLTGGKIHFTIHPEHLETAHKFANHLTEQYAAKGFTINIAFSEQEHSTDAIALNLEGTEIHRNPDGTPFFRQSGHGALSLNLNIIESPYILIQNVDNLPGGSDDIIRWKRAFMGLFFTVEERILVLARGLTNDKTISEDLVEEAHKFITGDLKYLIDKADFDSKDLKERADYLLNIVNRPLVVAAMVPNVGEVGGGPFLVRDNVTGAKTNQIVEGAQQDRSNPKQLAIVNRSTHFNPVFLVVNTLDSWGKKFDLTKYAKKDGGYVFYVEKNDSKGKKFASLDTGLWNGEIAKTLTLFVEMPLETFGPAKTVLDLSPNIRQFRNNPYPEILKNISVNKI